MAYERINVLPDIVGESVDVPKKFTNIDNEGFVFNWDGVPYGGNFPDRVKSTEEIVETKNINGMVIRRDVVKKHVVLKEIEPGETVVLPKYLVNHAANHLTRKMVKRVKLAEAKAEGKDPNARQGRDVNIRDEAMQGKLMEQCVAANFPGNVYPGSEPKVVAGDAIKEAPVTSDEKSELTCEECGFIAKNKTGLLAHKRSH